MPWFNVDDGFAVHAKTVRAGNAAIGLWVRAGSWCAQQLTDGFIPADIVAVLGSPAQAKRLVSAGLWKQVDGGYQFHEWETRQRSRETVLADRAYNARKAALYRDQALLEAVRKRDGGRCRYCGTLVDWNNRRGGSGGTYDHVDPSGPNALTNLVVACRSCNSRKSNRSPEDCEMPLLDPRAMGVSGGGAGQGDAYQNGTGDDLDVDQNSTGSEQDPLHSTPLQTKQQKTSSSVEPRKRGTRIPENFQVTPAMVAWAQEKCPLVDGRVETEKFVYHFEAEPGKNGVKLDWVLTWKKWFLKAQQDAVRFRSRRPLSQPQVNQTDANIAALLAGGSTPALQLIQGES